MKYEKPVMNKTELMRMGFDEAWLDYVFRVRTDRKIAWRGGNGTERSPIQYDTEELEKFRKASCTGD